MKERRRIWIPEAPMVNLRRYREVGVLNHSVGLDGWFDIELVHARSGLVKRKLCFPNLITDAGLISLAAGGDVISRLLYLAVGTGSTPPNVSDDALVEEIARTSSNGGFGDESGTVGSGDLLEYRWLTRTRVFTEAEANGNLTELGFFNTSSGGTLWNRQLFRDERGNPTTITKTSDDQLRVRYTVRIVPPWDDVVHDIQVNGTTYTVTERPTGVTNSVQWGAGIGGNLTVGSNSCYAATSALAGRGTSSLDGVQPTAATLAAHVAGTMYRDREFIWSPSVANFGIRRIHMRFTSNSGNTTAFQSGFEPALEKTDTYRLIVQSRVSFARHEP